MWDRHRHIVASRFSVEDFSVDSDRLDDTDNEIAS